MKTCAHLMTSAAVAAIASAAFAQPTMIALPLASPDLARSGNKVVGLTYDADADRYVPFIWTRGGQPWTSISVPGSVQSAVQCSDDASALALTLPNSANWGDLNCFAGYCFGDMSGCTPGDPLPPPSPCETPQITHRWTSAQGWVPTGSFTRTLDGATGRYYGGTRCDYDINSPNDMSGNGRYIVGGAWYSQLTCTNCPAGGPGFGLCGDFYAFRYDSLTGAFDQLLVPAGHRTSRADKVNFDGSVITGYDLMLVHNPDGTTDSIRQTVVWRNNVETVLDPYMGAKDNAAVNGPGTALAQGASAEFVAATFPGQSGVRLVRWTYQGGAWVPQNLGRPAPFLDPNSGIPFDCDDMWVRGISDDGNTIAGMASYSGALRPFVYKSTVNGGVPIDLAAYIATLDPSSPLLQTDFAIEQIFDVSANGNSLLVYYFDSRNTCAFNGPSLFTGSTAMLDLNGSACEAPRLNLQPADWVQDYDIRLGVAINAFASGTWPLTYQWQHENAPNSNTWTNLTDDCANFPPSDVDPWAYEGTATRQLRVGTGEGGANRGGRYRVIVSNSCGSVTSAPATVTFLSGACCDPFASCSIRYQGDCTNAGGTWQGAGATCATGCTPCGSADFNGDGDTGTDADIEAFFACLGGNCCATCGSADFNGDGDTGTDQDIEAFFRVLSGGTC